MDVVMLSRIQFAATVAYHFLFVPLSLGLALMLLIAERRYYKSGAAEDRTASEFLIKLFTTTFAIGVATGITMEFAFGTNWATYSRFVGDIFGAPLAAEGVFAFFLESTFLGVLLFGREKVSKKFYYVSAWLVFIGSHMSALWIIIANSWQQTPAGYKVENGRAILTDFFAAALNPSTLPRFFHTVVSTWTVGGFFVAGIAAWYLLKGRDTVWAKKALPVGLTVALIASLMMPALGDWSAKQVAATQPSKMAAFEGIYKSGTNQGLAVVGWVDESAKDVKGIVVPGALSFLIGYNTNTYVKGLDDYAVGDRPPVQATFQTYHAMVALGMLMILIAGLGLVFRKSIAEKRWLLWLTMAGFPAAMLAIQGGWAAAEIGRQPWIVWGELRTLDAISKVVPAEQILITLGLFALVYSLLFVGWSRIFFGLIGKGPDGAALAPADNGSDTAPVAAKS
ncbi:MAG: cytochrome ubiquinol oxidase subunit I [Coriobacteriia bacterium]|nr:cytochrome ubiquinol oxidase subunit I [Coriobacteriia bacterium]